MTTRSCTVALAIVAALALSACASRPALPGNSVASPQLERDTLNMLMLLDSAHQQECKQRRVVDRQTLSANASRAEERWTIDRCGSRFRYPITFTASPRGGTDFGVGSPEPVDPPR